jgi:general stress protein YciG
MANTSQNQNSTRGFASMDEQRQREIASQGGRAAHASGNAHEFTSEEARAAGRKGGEARANNARNAKDETNTESMFSNDELDGTDV